MKELLPDIHRWRAAGETVAIATVVEVRRSAPRPPGAKMAVSASGEVSGTVSGGCVEGAVVQAALEVLEGAAPRLLSFGIADDEAWEVGLPCGGEIDIWVEEHVPGPFDDAAQTDGRAACVTLISGDGLGEKLVVQADSDHSGSLGSESRDELALAHAGELLWMQRSERRGNMFIDVLAPPPRLLIVGASDVAAALCRLARTVGWQPWIIDPRSRFATRERFPDAECIVVAWPQEGFAKAGGIDPATSVVVLTHDPKIDDAALVVALRSPARFVGAMGSRRATVSRVERLQAAGLEDAEIERLSGPLGLDLGATGTAETALSMLAEIVAMRNGRSGGRLVDSAGRIHDVAA